MSANLDRRAVFLFVIQRNDREGETAFRHVLWHQFDPGRQERDPLYDRIAKTAVVRTAPSPAAREETTPPSLAKDNDPT